VYCQLELLRQCFPPSIRRVLEELPESLNETYERILRGIRKPNQGYAHRLLQCLVAAVRPLQVEELAEILAFDFDAEGIPKLNPSWRWEDQEEAVMSACSSLVVIVKGGHSRVVQFSHFSVKEFLTSDRLAKSSGDVSRYHVVLEHAHTILARACLGVLLQLDDRVDRDGIRNFPLAQYGARHWAEHTQFGNVSSRIKYGMECLFDANKPHFATWLWIHNEDALNSMTTARPEKPEAVPLYYAARFGFRDLVEHLLAKHPEDVSARGGSEVTPLHASMTARNADVFLLLIGHFPDVHIPGKFGQTPLHRASRMGHLEVGRWLLDHGADVNAQDVDGWSPLHLAAMGGQLDFARMLLEHHANRRDRNYTGEEATLHSTSREHLDGLRLLQSTNIDARTAFGETPLHLASSRNINVVRLLLERGANVHARNNVGSTPLHLASCGHVEIVRFLLEHGADITVRDVFGLTALGEAATGGWGEVVQLLSRYDPIL